MPPSKTGEIAERSEHNAVRRRTLSEAFSNHHSEYVHQFTNISIKRWHIVSYKEL